MLDIGSLLIAAAILLTFLLIGGDGDGKPPADRTSFWVAA